MARLTDIVGYADSLLDTAAFADYCPNGLQVEGRPEVQRLYAGVTACQALLEAAAAEGADAVLVHHGFFWRGEDPRVVGIRQRRLAFLLNSGMSLIAYHLPLDAHPELGNNAQLALRLKIPIEGRFGRDGLGMFGTLSEPLSAEAFAARLEHSLERMPLHVGPGGRPIRRVGWCSGAAQGFIEDAASLGLDAFVSGEVSEPTFHLANELGIDYFAAGHHATERYGVQALAGHLSARFALEVRYLEVDNPV